MAYPQQSFTPWQISSNIYSPNSGGHGPPPPVNNQAQGNVINNWQQPKRKNKYNPVETTRAGKSRQKKIRRRRQSGYQNLRCRNMLNKCGGTFGLIAIICGIIAIACAAFGMVFNEITSRNRGTSATKCGFFDVTLCNEFIVGTLKQNFDVDCEDVDGMECCTFKTKDACDLDYICGKTNPDCVYCHNLNAGSVFFWCSAIGSAVVCISTIAICIRSTRKWACIGYLLGMISIAAGLVAYPLMLGSDDKLGLVNEKGCGDNPFCCYFDDCIDGQHGGGYCPTPFSKTYIAMVVTASLCLICIVLLCIMRKKKH
eukprot:210069_1